MIGGSLGPITVGIDCGGAWNVGKMLQAVEQWPINFAFLGRGNSYKPKSLIDQIEGGVAGMKLHEDWGSMPAAIDCCLNVADDADDDVGREPLTPVDGELFADWILARPHRTGERFPDDERP